MSFLGSDVGQAAVGPLGAPATAAQLSEVEDRLASPLPADLRLVLQRHNGGQLPSGTLLSAGGPGSGGMLDTLIELAEQRGSSPHDPEVLVPFFRADDGAILAFDRTAGPVADTWPVVDYYPDSGDLRLVHRTFDGWCKLQVQEWTAPEFSAPFTLAKYLQSGQRHVAAEPDVSVAHATVAHALRRAGRPEEALYNYLQGGRCLPSQPWCDWEALKLAVLLDQPRAALEAASRLSTRAPEARWAERGTRPEWVAEVLSTCARRLHPRQAVLRIFDQLAEQAGDETGRRRITALRRALDSGTLPPPPQPMRPTAVPPPAAPDALLDDLCAAYLAGQVRDEDLILDPAYADVRGQLLQVIRQPREF